MKSAQELGAVLKEARAAKKLDLGTLSETTGLPEKYLRALETGRHDQLPGKAYARIYYINYARALGLDTEVLMVDWPQPESQPTASPIVQPPNPWPKRIGILASIAIVLVITFSIWKEVGIDTWDSTGEEPDTPATSLNLDYPGETFSDTNADSAPESAADTNATSSTTSDDSGTETTAIAPPPAPEPEPVTLHTLKVRANGQTWVKIVSDSTVVDTALLEIGEVLTAEATRDFLLTVTIPGAVRAFLDDSSITLPGNPARRLVDYKIDLRSEGGTP